MAHALSAQLIAYTTNEKSSAYGECAAPVRHMAGGWL